MSDIFQAVYTIYNHISSQQAGEKKQDSIEGS
jgi:hypothetical protein